MRKLCIFLVMGLGGAVLYVVFLHLPVCLGAAANRNHLFSDVGLCAPFVDISLEQVRARFEHKVKPGDDRQKIEDALTQIGILHSWDGMSSRYQGIIRHPDSNFHAVVIHVYVDGQAKYQRIEIRDSFTAL